MIYGNIVNKDFWDSLGPDLQAKMQEAMDYACTVERDTMNSEDAMYSGKRKRNSSAKISTMNSLRR